MLNYIKMGLILAVVCVLSAWGLAYVYLATGPQIENNKLQARAKAEAEVLPHGGTAVAVAPRGYGGPIEMLVGIDKAGKVSGVKVINQRETPGLGTNVAGTKFLTQFLGKTKRDQLEPKKDIDAITGATISSRAACLGVKEALEKVKK